MAPSVVSSPDPCWRHRRRAAKCVGRRGHQTKEIELTLLLVYLPPPFLRDLCSKGPICITLFFAFFLFRFFARNCSLVL